MGFEYWLDETNTPHCELYTTRNSSRILSPAECGTTRRKPRVFQRISSVVSADFFLRRLRKLAKDYEMAAKEKLLGLFEELVETFLANSTDELTSLARSKLNEVYNVEQDPGFSAPRNTSASAGSPHISLESPGDNTSNVINGTDSQQAPCTARESNISNSNSSTIVRTNRNDCFQEAYKKTVTTTTNTTNVCSMPTSPLLTPGLHNLNTNALDEDLKQLAQLLTNNSSAFYLLDLLVNWTVTRNDTRDHIVFTEEDMTSMRTWLPWGDVAASPLRWRFLGAQWDVTWNIASITIHHLSRSRIELWQGSDPHVRNHKLHVAAPVKFGVELRAKAMSEGGLFDGWYPALSIPEHTIRLNLEFDDINLHLSTFVCANETRMRIAVANYDARCVAQAISQFTTTFAKDMQWHLSSINASATYGSDNSTASYVSQREQELNNFVTSALETNLSRAIIENVLARAVRVYIPQWTEKALLKAREAIAQSQNGTAAKESCTSAGGGPVAEGTTEKEQEKRQAKVEGRDDIADNGDRDHHHQHPPPNNDDAPFNMIPTFCALWKGNCKDGRLALVAFEGLPLQITLPAAMVRSNSLQIINDTGVSFSNIDLEMNFALSVLSLPINVHIDFAHVPIVPDIKSPSSQRTHSRDHLFACAGWASLSSARLTWLPCYGVLHPLRWVVSLLHDAINNTRVEGLNNVMFTEPNVNVSVPLTIFLGDRNTYWNAGISKYLPINPFGTRAVFDDWTLNTSSSVHLGQLFNAILHTRENASSLHVFFQIDDAFDLNVAVNVLLPKLDSEDTELHRVHVTFALDGRWNFEAAAQFLPTERRPSASPPALYASPTCALVNVYPTARIRHFMVPRVGALHIRMSTGRHDNRRELINVKMPRNITFVAVHYLLQLIEFENRIQQIISDKSNCKVDQIRRVKREQLWYGNLTRLVDVAANMTRGAFPLFIMENVSLNRISMPTVGLAVYRNINDDEYSRGLVISASAENLTTSSRIIEADFVFHGAAENRITLRAEVTKIRFHINFHVLFTPGSLRDALPINSCILKNTTIDVFTVEMDVQKLCLGNDCNNRMLAPLEGPLTSSLGRDMVASFFQYTVRTALNERLSQLQCDATPHGVKKQNGLKVLANLTVITNNALSLLGGARTVLDNLLRSKSFVGPGGSRVEFIELVIGSVELGNSGAWDIVVKRARIKISWTIQLCTLCPNTPIIIDVLLEKLDIVAAFQLLAGLPQHDMHLYRTINCLVADLGLSGRVEHLHLRNISVAFLNATIGDAKPWLNWVIPMDLVNKSLELVAEDLKRWDLIQLPLDINCTSNSIQRDSLSQKWNPQLDPVPRLQLARQTALEAVVHDATFALTEDMLEFAAIAVTEMVSTDMRRAFVSALVRSGLLPTPRLSDNSQDGHDDFNLILRIHRVGDAGDTQRDLFGNIKVALLNNSRVELFFVTNDLSASNEVTISLSLVFPEITRPTNWPPTFHLSTNITNVQLHVLLTPSNESDSEVLKRAPWCVLDKAVLDLFALEIDIVALCVSGETPCVGHGTELAPDETSYLKTMLVTFFQDALHQKKLDTLCHIDYDNDQGNKKGGDANNNDVNNHIVPLLNLTQLAKQAKFILAPMCTEFFNNQLQSWLPHRIPLAHSSFSVPSLFKNTTSLRNWTVTVRNLTNVTFHDDGATTNDDEDGVLSVKITIGAIEVEVAVEVVFSAYNKSERVWSVMTRIHAQGIQTTVAVCPFIPKSALHDIMSDWFTPDWGCLLHKLRPSFSFSRIHLYTITSTTFQINMNTHEVYSTALPRSSVAIARFFAMYLIGHRVNIDSWFINTLCADQPISRNTTSKRYQLAPAQESKLRDFEPTAQLAMRAMNALVFNQMFFQSFLSKCVQWFNGEGGPNRIDGTDDLFVNGAGSMDVQIVGGRFEVVVSTPPQRPITITFNDATSALRTKMENITPKNLNFTHNIVGSRILQAHAIVDHIRFQALFDVTKDASKFLGKPAEWWTSGCALGHIDIDLLVLEFHLSRFCFELSCTTDLAPHEAALLRKAMATLFHVTSKIAFYRTARSACVENYAKYPKENERDREERLRKGPLPPQGNHQEWEGSVRWGKKDLLRVAHAAIERLSPYLRTSHEESEEDVMDVISINGMVDFLHRQGRVIPLSRKVFMGEERDGVIIEVGNLVLYAPQKETLALSGCTIMNLTTNAERDALVTRINDTSWELFPDDMNDILGLPSGATLLQIREQSTNRWHHPRANESVRQLLRDITIDGTTTLTFAHAANASIHFSDTDTMLFSGRLDHVAVNGPIRALTGPLVAMAEDVILQEDDSRTVVRAYVASVLEHEWRNIWSTEITGNGWVNVTFDMDAYVVSDARAPDMNGIYSRLHVDGNEALYTNGKFRLQWNSSAAIWELRSVEDNDGDDIIVRSLTANAEGEWEGLRLIMRKVSNATRVPSAKLTLLHDNAIYPQRISSNGPVVGMHFDVSVDDSCHRVRLINLTNKDSPKPELERKSSFACTGTAQLKIKITSNNTLLVIRSSAPTIRFDVLNAEDVALGAKIGLSDATFSLQGAASILPKSPPAWHHFHVELEVYDFNAEVLMLARTLDGFFDIPKLLLTGLTSCHMQSLSRETLIKKLSVSSRLASVCFLSSAPNATASPEMVTVSFDRDGLDNMLLRDLSTSLLSAFVVPFVNKAIAPVKESSSCDESEGGKNGTWIEFVLITYIAFALGCVSAGIGFAYDCWRDGGCSPRARRRRASTEVNVFDSNGPLAFHPVVPIGMRFAVPLFIVAILFGLLVPVFFPSVDEMSTFQVRDKEYGFVNTATILLKQHSLWGTIADMYASQAFALFMVVLLLSGVLPYIKCLLILLAWCAPSHVLSLRYRSRLIHVAHFMGKYALVDVFLVIIIIGFGRIKVSVPSNHYTRIHIDAHYSPDMGFFFFSFSNCLSLVMSDTVMRYHQQTSYEVVQRTISLHNKIPFKDIVAYNLMLRLAKSPSAGLESPLPILPACLPHPFSLSEFYQQSALTQRKRLVKEDSALCWHGHIYRWMRMRWLDLLVKERYILPFFLCGTLIFLYVAFLFDAVVVTYGGLFGYLMNTSGQQKGDAFYITTDQRFSISKFGSDFANASVFDGQPDAHAYIVQILFFLTTLIIPTVIIIGCLILWYFPLPIQCWPTINAYMLSFRTYSTFHILVLTIILEQFSIARFGGYMLGKYCASITPLLDAMYGHLFEGSCASIAANECVWMMLLGTCAMVDILGVCLVARRIEHLSELVSATVQDPFLAPVSCTLEEPDLSQSGESKREINP
eukprot:GEMP01000057.1.p1 GENE.GEMP01000057.1~~GEMP01000057.1.p1  ORF type:complete len:3718 (+),score=497.04 GEMP01000057.1:1317-11156(+)